MSNFNILYGYELKKIAQKKILWITLFICVITIAFSLLFPLTGSYYVDGVPIDSNYHMFLTDRNYRKALTGRSIDQTLLTETHEAYNHVPMDIVPYTLTEEYQTYARPYSEIFNLIRTWTQLDADSAARWIPDEASLYDSMNTHMLTVWHSNNLSDSEITYWQNRFDTLRFPFVYQYHDGYVNILEVFLTIGFLMILFIAISLSTAFPDEHTRRTDQLILCTGNGRSRIYWIKLLAGLTVGLIGTLFIIGFTWILSLSIYGAEGFDTVVQLFYTTYAGNLTIGQACVIAYCCLLITAVLMSIFVMFLSELLHSGIASLSIVTGLLVASALLQVPTQYRILGQIWDYLPTSFLAMWNTFDCRLITIFGNCFTSYEVVPLLYLLAAIILAMLGKQIYVRYQISGR